MIDTEGWSERKKTLHRYLKRAFDENRGAEAILLWQWRKALVAHENEDGVKALKKFEENNAGKPRAVRTLNLIQQQGAITPPDNDAKPKDAHVAIASTPEHQQIIVRRSKLSLEFDQVKSAYQMACEDEQRAENEPEIFLMRNAPAHYIQ